MTPFDVCARCGHLGFSHDNWDECAECECPKFEKADVSDSGRRQASTSSGGYPKEAVA